MAPRRKRPALSRGGFSITNGHHGSARDLRDEPALHDRALIAGWHRYCQVRATSLPALGLARFGIVQPATAVLPPAATGTAPDQ